MVVVESSKKGAVAVGPELVGLRLKSCNIAGRCNAACCMKGVRVEKGEAAGIAAFVAANPGYFGHIEAPAAAFVPLDAIGQPGLCHTELVNPQNPARGSVYRRLVAGQPVSAHDHEGSRCVFLRDDLKCSLQVASAELGFHKWEYKPTPCWLFPLAPHLVESQEGKRLYQLHWTGEASGKLAHYPCARREPDGDDAVNAVLKEEIEYFAARNLL